MFKDLVWKYYYKANGYNYSCSEAMIHASNDYFHLDLSEDVFRLVCAYSGGAGPRPRAAPWLWPIPA